MQLLNSDRAKNFGFKDNIIELPDEIGVDIQFVSISASAILELGEDFKNFLIGGHEAEDFFK